jgi:hypothetical protein
MSQRLPDRVVEQSPGGRIVGHHCASVLDQVGEAEVVLVAHRLLQ